jgi:hypothetical protein
MIFPQRLAERLKQFAQPRRGYAMVGLSTYRHVRPLLALVLAKFTREVNRIVQAMAFHMLIDDREIL